MNPETFLLQALGFWIVCKGMDGLFHWLWKSYNKPKEQPALTSSTTSPVSIHRSRPLTLTETYQQNTPTSFVPPQQVRDMVVAAQKPVKRSGGSAPAMHEPGRQKKRVVPAFSQMRNFKSLSGKTVLTGLTKVERPEWEQQQDAAIKAGYKSFKHWVEAMPNANWPDHMVDKETEKAVEYHDRH